MALEGVHRFKEDGCFGRKKSQLSRSTADLHTSGYSYQNVFTFGHLMRKIGATSISDNGYTLRLSINSFSIFQIMTSIDKL